MNTSCAIRKLRNRSRLRLERCCKTRTNTATRPLSIRKNGAWYTYGHDLTKNVMEVFNTSGGIATTYDYTPFGAVTTQGTFEQPLQWSSEVYDAELALTYYNYRHYNPMDGRWINRDPIAEQGGINLYGFVGNGPVRLVDVLGQWSAPPPKDPKDAIFIYPYSGEGRINGREYSLEGYVESEHVVKFYVAIAKLAKKQVNGRKCYKIYINSGGSATVGSVKEKKCDIKFIIGHGSKVDGKDYVKLKDGQICISDLNNPPEQICQGFGCYIGENKGEIPHCYALILLTQTIEKLSQGSDCSCKQICIFSGPVNQ